MKSGLEGRNNLALIAVACVAVSCLNEVRPRKPEQCAAASSSPPQDGVSMKSGLEGRNNSS